MWRELRKVFPKILASVPIGIKNHTGKTITKTSTIKQIIVKQRMRKRPPNPQIKYIMKLKEENSLRVIALARQVKTPNWSQDELSKVLKKLKSGKCRDPGGLINEIFKPGVIGSDLQESLLDLFNICKSQMKIT